MTYKKFHIWDFPEDKVRILLDNNIGFWNNCVGKFGSVKKISDYLGTSTTTVLKWKHGKGYIPLRVLRKLVKKSDFTLKEIERNIVSYRGLGNCKPVIHPRLPIEESPELFSIITHFMCDGCISSERVPIYINSSRDLLENFVDLVKKVFGDVPVSKRKLKNEIKNYVLPKVISDIILKFYNISFDSKNSKLPEKILELSDKFGCSVIRTIVDDEGSIKNNGVVLCMKNKQLMLQVRDLLRKVLGRNSVGEFSVRKGGLCEFRIRSSYMDKFYRKIKLVHPVKKGDVKYYVRKQKIRKLGRGELLWETKYQILKLLKNKYSDLKHLSRKLFINPSNIGGHLNQLSNMGYVKKIRIDKYSPIWGITEQGLSFLEKWGISSRKKSIRIPDWHKRFDIKNKQCRILMNSQMRKRLFWMLERTLGNQSKISNHFSVHRNTICFWKNGNTLIPLNSLNQILMFLGNNGVDLVDEVSHNIVEVRSINGIFKWYRR